MSVHLHRAIEELKRHILDQGALVEETVRKAVTAVTFRDAILAQEVINGDEAIDLAEVVIEEECLKILALHQPVAADLRFIVAVLKMNSDLERIGDLSANIASRALKLSQLTTTPEAHIEFQDGEAKVQQMLRQSLESLVRLDEKLARLVCSSDEAIDEINRSVYKQVIKAIKEHPNDVDRFILLLSVSRNLERIADHATNIAEDVLYMVGGEIVRHTRIA